MDTYYVSDLSRAVHRSRSSGTFCWRRSWKFCLRFFWCKNPLILMYFSYWIWIIKKWLVSITDGYFTFCTKPQTKRWLDGNKFEHSLSSASILKYEISSKFPCRSRSFDCRSRSFDCWSRSFDCRSRSRRRNNWSLHSSRLKWDTGFKQLCMHEYIKYMVHLMLVWGTCSWLSNSAS